MKKFHIVTTDDHGVMMYGRLIAGQRNADATFNQEVIQVRINAFARKVQMTTLEKGQTVVVRSYEK